MRRRPPPPPEAARWPAPLNRSSRRCARRPSRAGLTDFLRWWQARARGAGARRLARAPFARAASPTCAVEARRMASAAPRVGHARGGRARATWARSTLPGRRAAFRRLVEEAGGRRGQRLAGAAGRGRCSSARAPCRWPPRRRCATRWASSSTGSRPSRQEQACFDYRVTGRDAAAQRLVDRARGDRRARRSTRASPNCASWARPCSGVGVAGDLAASPAPFNLLAPEARERPATSRAAMVARAPGGPRRGARAGGARLPALAEARGGDRAACRGSRRRRRAPTSPIASRRRSRSSPPSTTSWSRRSRASTRWWSSSRTCRACCRTRPGCSSSTSSRAPRCASCRSPARPGSSSQLIEVLEKSGSLANASFKSPLTKGVTPGTERFLVAAEVKPRAAAGADARRRIDCPRKAAAHRPAGGGLPHCCRRRPSRRPRRSGAGAGRSARASRSAGRAACQRAATDAAPRMRWPVRAVPPRPGPPPPSPAPAGRSRQKADHARRHGLAPGEAPQGGARLPRWRPIAAVVGARARCPLWLAHRHYDEALEDIDRRLVRYERLAAARPALQAEARGGPRHGQPQVFPQGLRASLSAAEIQERVRQFVEGNGGRLISVQVAQPKEDGRFRQVTVTVQANANICAHAQDPARDRDRRALPLRRLADGARAGAPGLQAGARIRAGDVHPARRLRLRDRGVDDGDPAQTGALLARPVDRGRWSRSSRSSRLEHFLGRVTVGRRVRARRRRSSRRSSFRRSRCRRKRGHVPETVARPLFVPTRRPSPPVATAAAPTMKQGTVRAYRRHGHAGGGLRLPARRSPRGKTHSVKKGTQVNGITVDVVEPRRVVLQAWARKPKNSP